ncbi:MAG: molybdopterin-dependent oxidoreductase [Streptosporangiaceae bacterium]|nr:molybdopterin-dependent oxidoreductase [Streptosporangiaceae bacterium]MBV9855490.1 molybdopterin-dependent oxidoreductase [Streptosporangiaceae bacterium]
MNRDGRPSGRPSVDRRKFLTASAATAGLAATAGVAGKVLIGKRPAPSASPGGGSSSAAGGTGAGGTGGGTGAPATQGPAQAAPALQAPAGAELSVPGISPFYTATSQLYRTDTAIKVPQVSQQAWQLRIHGMVDRPITIGYDQLIRRPMLEHDVTLTCVAYEPGGSLVGNARWHGTLLADLLREAGVQAGADQLVMRDVQGMNIGIATDAVLDGRKALLAIGMNGQPLPPVHGYPARVVVPGVYGFTSACKWVVDMELTTFQAFTTYWTRSGWAEYAPIKISSRIDVPKTGARITAGKAVIAGVAWEQRRGIEAVEVYADGGWHEATLAAQDNPDTWRQWYYRWDATPGSHTIRVRATDKTGHVQTSAVQTGKPSGSTGLHTIQVTVV